MTIEEIFETLKTDSIAYDELSASLQKAKNKKNFIQKIKKQSEQGAQIYLRCKKAMEELKQVLSLPITLDIAEKLYSYTCEIYYDNWADTFVLKMLAEHILPYYESKSDVERIITLNMILGYSYTDLARINKSLYITQSVSYYKKAIEYRFHPLLMEDSNLAKRIVTAFYNVVIVASTISGDFVPHAWEYYDIFKEWIKTDFCKELVEKYSFLEDEMNDINLFFYGTMFDIAPDIHREFLETVIEEKWNQIQEQTSGDIGAEYCDTYVSHIRITVYHHPEMAREYYKEFVSYYEKSKSTIRGDEYITGFYTASLDLIRGLFQMIDFTKEERTKEAEYIKGQMLEYIEKESESPIANSILTECIPDLLFKYHFLDLYETVEEKADLLFSMFIKRHISTYLHSNMVANFAKAIGSIALVEAPELFVGLPDIKDVPTVKERKDEILKMIHQNAVLHDIGKIGIQDIVSRQYRPIMDEEFAMLKEHPFLGDNYLYEIPELKEFADVAYGHHKFYDGSGGYPKNYDNTASPYRIITDLITLADCLDAATDSLGRNYRTVKSVDTVIEEFIKDAGTRYNPDLVFLISRNDSIKEQLRRIAVDDREALACEIYQEGI